MFPENDYLQICENMPENDISYLGMSALDQWMPLCFNRESNQRLVWADLRKRVVEEAFLAPEALQTALRKALEEYKRLMAR